MIDALLHHSRRATTSVFVGCIVIALSSVGRTQSIEADSVLLRLIDEVDVPARALGALAEIRVSEGSPVESGDELGRIDDTEVQLDFQRAKYETEIAQHEATDDVAIRSAKESMRYAGAHYDRLIRADRAQPKSVSESELEKARLDAEKAKFEMENGQSDLKKAVIRKNLAENQLAVARRNVEVRKILAPQNGVVVNVLRRPGEWVQPGEKIFRIVSTKRLRAEGFVQSDQARGDLKGKPVTVTPQGDGHTGEVFTGTIVFVSPEIDPVNGQVRVLADVKNPNEVLRPGLRVQMLIHPE